MRLCRRGLSGVDLAILRELDNDNGSFAGIRRMAEAVECDNHHHVRERLRLLRRSGVLVLEYPRRRPGRGRKVIIRKREAAT